MSLQGFADGIQRDILRGTSRGCQMTRIWVCPETEMVIMKGIMTSPPCEAIDVTPELRVHGVPVRSHRSVPVGHAWYVYKGLR